MGGGEVIKISSFPRKREPSKAKKNWVPAFAGMTMMFSLVMPALADSDLPAARWANEQLPDPRQEAQAKALMEELRCLVCQGQSIADSNAELAGDMRAMVRQRIANGEKPEQVRAWLIQRYGNWVSYRPPVEPVTWPLWAAPILLLLAGAWLLRKRLVRRRG
jgi:cytochrome c-type biogenesis protein CcmH